ncbi:tyrosine-type recombinase/integrase, partial [Tessaracoccus lubricantis]
MELPQGWLALLEDYAAHLAAERGLSAHTVRAYGTDLRELAASCGIAPGRVTLSTLRSWLGAMRDEGAAASTVQRRVACVRGFFAWAAREGLVASDPAVRLKAPKRQRRLPKVLPAGAVAETLAAAESRAGEEGDPIALRDLALVEVLYSSGLRVSEACSLQLRDVDRDRRSVSVLGKGGKQRTVPLGVPALRALEDWLRVRGAVS